MTDFLLELLSEEIPARMQLKAKEDLARLFTEALAKAGIAATSIETFATPRRLALIAHGLPLSTDAVREETKGPKVGAPPQAMEGFLRKTGLTQEQLVERDGVYFAVVERAGRATADVLTEAIPAIIRTFPWPKSQRWGAASSSTESLRWVRPLQGIVALLGDDVVPCAIEGITSGRETRGHRFHSTGPVSIANAGTYAEDLRAARVIVHYSERCAIIREGAAKAATDAGLVLVEDEGLVSENAGLTEWPVPMLGRFDPAYLGVPEEVIQLTARVNQKYFVCRDSADALAPAFVCTANIVANDGGAAIVAGNEKVLSARLSDAKFFWETDLKVPLADQAAKLGQITFHEKLGTVADKVERVAKLARWLVDEGIVAPLPLAGGAGGGSEVAPSSDTPTPNPSRKREGNLATLADRAARLCKADLVTGSVGEFPELQGIMGGHLARAQDEGPSVADAIRDHYKPVGHGDDVPTAPVTVAVSLADKLDTLLSFFGIDVRPTGSKDPFALRRAALGIIALVTENKLRFPMAGIIARQLSIFRMASLGLIDVSEVSAFRDYGDRNFGFVTDGATQSLAYGGKPIITWPTRPLPGFEEFKFIMELKGAEEAVWAFLADRLKVQQREAGVRHDLIDAVFALGGEDDLVRLLARVHALQDFVGTEDGVNLLAGYKRSANLLKQAGADAPLPLAGGAGGGSDMALPSDRPTPDPSRKREGGHQDQALLTALNHAEPTARAAVESEDFTAAMAALASLRAPIDAFFDGVMVNDPDPAIRAFRLSLLARFRDAVHAVADFSKIEG
jgi:glycyl-tRNA synthetase beta chain